jgi:hypothetical protein
MDSKKLDNPIAITVGNLVLWIDTISQIGFVVEPRDRIAYIVDKDIWIFNNA